MKNFCNQSEKGFTLIEVLVSLAIFSIAITGVITVAVRGGQTTNIVKLRVEAQYLADEGIELARSLRDTGILVGNDPAAPGSETPDLAWQDVIVTGSPSLPYTALCSSSHPCDIDVRNYLGDVSLPFPNSGNVISCGTTGSYCQLYYDGDASHSTDLYFGYYLNDPSTPSGSLQPSPFKRSIVMTPINPPSGGAAYPEEVQVTATVVWMEGTYQRSISQTENLYDWYQ